MITQGSRPMLASHLPTLGNHLVLQARLMHDLYTQCKPPPYTHILLAAYKSYICAIRSKMYDSQLD